jgi:SPP1 gp7 family putative phage head morphogenesis protein
MARLPIRPIIIVEASPHEIEKDSMVRISTRMFDKKRMTLMEVSRIYMEITSMKDGHTVWPLEVVRRNATGFDIGIGTQEMKTDHEYLVRVSNNENLSPSASTTFRVKPSTFPLVPIILPLILSPLFLKKYSDKGIRDISGLTDYLKGQGFPDDKIKDEVERIMKELDQYKDDEIPDDSIKIPIDTYRDPIKKMFITQMDHRVCPKCKEYEFKVFNYDDPTAPFIPVHLRCRCTFNLIYADDTREAAFKTAAIMSIVGRDLEAPIQAIQIINDNFY